MNGVREDGLEGLDRGGGRTLEGRGDEGDGGGGTHTLHEIKAEEMNKEKHTYLKLQIFFVSSKEPL